VSESTLSSGYGHTEEVSNSEKHGGREIEIMFVTIVYNGQYLFRERGFPSARRGG
jgi:hypothetical protein